MISCAGLNNPEQILGTIILWITSDGLLILKFWILGFFDTSTMSEVPEQFGGGKMEFLAGGAIVALFIISLVIAKRVRR